MRLNFSGVPESEIREGVRRIGEVVHEQVAMYGTLTGAPPARAAQSAQSAPFEDDEPELGRVLRLRKRA